ncbi:hypothetical protein [Asticcacaulis sp.]|uniref:hypothetical protein n=1 Tax=Asticcacaulis sp. TaxID=1872648 RepID=UPI002C3E9CBF|nr:hypothetical protein [Asticcacaulis sp.]HTM79920.1 hypothetical protein [Asticcacaulis sp.]
MRVLNIAEMDAISGGATPDDAPTVVTVVGKKNNNIEIYGSIKTQPAIEINTNMPLAPIRVVDNGTDRGDWWAPSSIKAGEIVFGGRDVQGLSIVYGKQADGHESVYRDPDTNQLYIDRDGNGRVDAQATIGANGNVYARTLSLGGYDIMTDLKGSQIAPAMRSGIGA